MQNLLSIGEFSRTCRLSVKTLRRYADQGLLVPAWVDPATGYRYYRAIQALEAERIRLLRELDLPLADVRQVLQSQDPERVSQILAAHQERLRLRIEAQQAALARLEELRHAALPAYPVRLHTAPPTPCLTVRLRTDFDGFVRQIGPTLGHIANVIHRQGAQPDGAPFARYHQDEFDPDDIDAEIGIPLSTPLQSAGDVQSCTLPTGPLASTLHAGPHEQVGGAYAALLSWMAEHGRRRAGPPMESYLVAPKHGVRPADYRTEVSWPVT